MGAEKYINCVWDVGLHVHNMYRPIERLSLIGSAARQKATHQRTSVQELRIRLENKGVQWRILIHRVS
jgi:hypothetical protein